MVTAGRRAGAVRARDPDATLVSETLRPLQGAADTGASRGTARPEPLAEGALTPLGRWR
jgi:hypothetical protein